MNDVVSPLFTEQEAAAYLRIAVATLRRWRWKGGGPTFIKVGGRVRYESQALDDLISDGRRSSTSDADHQEAESPAAHSP